jgi:hypothetical protein
MKKIYIIILMFSLSCLHLNAQWTLTSPIPPQGVITELAADSINLFGGTNSNAYGNYILTTDNGNTYTSIINGMPQFNEVYCIAIHDSTFFTGTYGWANGANGIYISNDNGANWIAANNGLPNSGNVFVEGFGFMGNKIFVGIAQYGVYLSTNNGGNWTNVSTGLSGIQFGEIAVSDSQIFVETDLGIFKSVNSGTSWTAVNNGLPNNGYFTQMASIGSYVFVGTDYGKIFLSTNYGNSWSQVYHGSHVSKITTRGSKVFQSNGGKVLMSLDSGFTWINTHLDTCGSIESVAANSTYLFAADFCYSRIWKFPLSQLTEIKEKQIENIFEIYPNPFASNISIKYEKENIKQASIAIKNILGQTVFKKQENNFSNSYTKTFDLSFLSKGIYLLDVTVDGERAVKKIVKE